jgi:hypothetical protein
MTGRYRLTLEEVLAAFDEHLRRVRGVLSDATDDDGGVTHGDDVEGPDDIDGDDKGGWSLVRGHAVAGSQDSGHGVIVDAGSAPGFDLVA